MEEKMVGFWRTREKELLKRYYRTHTPMEMSKMLNRSVRGVIKQLEKMSLRVEERECRHCGKKFKPGRRDQIYCSRKCGYEEYRKRLSEKEENFTVGMEEIATVLEKQRGGR
ncbi:hypothetical protein DRN97_02150 [Methanosarcinales archaeon]|nr:MAG: hypothetical protein DRN97_02150 [Methanosarcinales archaeon]